MDLLARWDHLVERAGAPALRPEGAALVRAWNEPHRAYHTVAHLVACLDELPVDAAEPLAVELALWYHDAVYQPTAKDNEARSAAWADRSLTAAGRPELAGKVAPMVLATAGHATDDADTAWVLDIDLAVLGRAPAEYDAFERQVRQEYLWVPEPLYRQGRRKVLVGFLERPRIFLTGRFSEREAQARANLSRAIAELG